MQIIWGLFLFLDTLFWPDINLQEMLVRVGLFLENFKNDYRF